MAHLTCPTCGLDLRPRTLLYAPHYCPRCLADDRTIVVLDHVPEPRPRETDVPAPESRVPALHSYS